MPKAVFYDSAMVKALIELRSPDATALSLFLCGGGDIREAAAHFGWNADRIATAFALLDGAGLVPSDETLGKADIVSATEMYPEFAELVKYAGMRRGKPLSNVDIERLLSLYTQLGLSVGAMFILISYSCECKGRDWPGLASIEREAYRWKAAGVSDEASAELHVRQLEKHHTDTARLARLLQIKGREPTRSERGYLEKWAALGLGDEVVYAAYDKTVVATGKLVWSYMDKILAAWAAEGAPEIQSEDAPRASPQKRVSAAERIRKLEGGR